MRKAARENVEVVKIPKYCDFKNFLNTKYKVCDLNQIQKHYGIKKKKGQRKNETINEIYNYLRNSFYVEKIQRQGRGYLIRKFMKLHGPAVFNRALCVNECDFYSLDEIKTIPYNEFFSFKDINDNKIYGFTIHSFSQLITKSRDNSNILNPYTRNKLHDNIVTNQFGLLLKMCKVLKIKCFSLEDTKQPKLTKKQLFNQRVTGVFKAMDDLGNYTDQNWFLDLNTNIKLIKFIRELHDIWSYRAQLSQDIKNNITNFMDPFLNINMINIQNVNYDILRNITLSIIEAFVYKGINQESRTLGAYYILLALTLVNPNAAEAMPWLYSSVA